MEQTVEQKLKALYDLQTIHTKIDKIRQVRGELPMEVADLEDDVAGLETRIQKIKAELDDLEDDIVTRKNLIKDAQNNIKKYEAQLNEVKNNREYDAISKEIEIQGLDIQVSEKKIKEFGYIETAEPKPLIRLACQAQSKGAVSIVIPPWNGQLGKYLKSLKKHEGENEVRQDSISRSDATNEAVN